MLELLDAGINVIGAFNVQHLESLNDLVERVTGVEVRETIPDTFLQQADQVVNLDLAVEDLQERLRAGKIYQADKVPWALEHFFQHDNLVTLRELALREVAESLERTAAAGHPPPTRPPHPAAGRVMVCLSSFPPHAAALLRRGSRIAGRLNTDWFVVYVETPAEAPNLIDAEAQRHLFANIEKASEPGRRWCDCGPRTRCRHYSTLPAVTGWPSSSSAARRPGAGAMAGVDHGPAAGTPGQ